MLWKLDDDIFFGHRNEMSSRKNLEEITKQNDMELKSNVIRKSDFHVMRVCVLDDTKIGDFWKWQAQPVCFTAVIIIYSIRRGIVEGDVWRIRSNPSFRTNSDYN